MLRSAWPATRSASRQPNLPAARAGNRRASRLHEISASLESGQILLCGASGGVRNRLGRLLQEPIQAGAADTENLRGADAIAVTRHEHALDVQPPHLVHRQRAPIFVEPCAIQAPARLLEMRGKIG